jgi:ParB family transcriptional regulator, chromosome partitioning protein
MSASMGGGMGGGGMGDRAKRPQLGRGLSALFGESSGRVLSGPGAPRTVPIEAIRPSPFQPRRRFVEAELDGLVQSIREKGIVQPLLVRPVDGLVDDSGDRGAEFELVAGERRWRAAQRAGLHEVPVVIRPLGDSEVLEIALVENLQREDLTPLEEAEAYSRLMAEFGHSQADVAETIGKSRSHVANTLRLLSLPDAVKRQLDEGALTAGHARALLAAPDPAALAGEVVRRGLNVRATELLVRRRGERPEPRQRKPRDHDTVALERDLGASLGLRVTVSQSGRGGSLTLHYASLEQLDRVLKLLRGG